MAEHRLEGGTLNADDDGVKARCTCGWSSGARFSSAAASVAFRDHQEEAAKVVWCPFCNVSHAGGATCLGHHP